MLIWFTGVVLCKALAPASSTFVLLDFSPPSACDFDGEFVLLHPIVPIPAIMKKIAAVRIRRFIRSPPRVSRVKCIWQTGRAHLSEVLWHSLSGCAEVDCAATMLPSYSA